MLLEIQELFASYGREPILRGMTLGVDPGECVGLFGPNGAGKSTLLKAIVGLVRVIGGVVTLGGVPVTGFEPSRLAREGMVLVPQGHRVFPSLTVLENIDVMLHHVERRERLRQREMLLERFPELRRRAHLPAGRLSGGEQQIVALARALALSPRILLLDEPSHGLSAEWSARVWDILRGLRERGLGLLLVEQKVAEASTLVDRGYVVREGRVDHPVSSGAELIAVGARL